MFWLKKLTKVVTKYLNIRYLNIRRNREDNGTPLQYLVGYSPCGHTESDTTERLHFHFHALEKEMATHSSALAWRIPGMGEPGGCRLWGRTESDMTEAI